MMRSVFLLICTLSLSAARAQANYGFEEAFIMMKAGDSLRGFVEVAPSYGSKIEFKKEKDDAQTSLSTKDIKFIATPNRYLENVQVDNKELLMTLVADGKARLFLQVVSQVALHRTRFGSTPYESQVLVFVLKKGLTSIEVTRKRYREILSGLMYDCPEVVQKLREKAFTYEEMDKAVKYYNACR
jgi:hypothetical protein